MGHGSWILGHGSASVWVSGSWVTGCDPLPALVLARICPRNYINVNVYILMYSVSQKVALPLKLFAIFSLRLIYFREIKQICCQFISTHA